MKSVSGFGAMLRVDLHLHASELMSNHIGHILYSEGWAPKDVAFAGDAIREILSEELPKVLQRAVYETTKAFDGDFGHLVPAIWATQYLALAERVARIVCGKGE